MTNTTNLWLYLARRDSKGVRILTVFKGKSQPATRITDLGVLQMPQAWQIEIAQIVDENKMMWEPFIESADSYTELRNNLRSRGYKNLPMNGQAEFRRDVEPSEINVSKLPKQNSMLRRGS